MPSLPSSTAFRGPSLISKPLTHHIFPLQMRQSSFIKPGQTYLTLQTSHYSTQPSKPPSGNPSFGAASFKDLGASRTVKVVVIIAISIIATAETITYGTWIWRKFNPPTEGDGGEKKA